MDYSGVGDYARSNGNTVGSGYSRPTGETYDLVIVGVDFRAPRPRFG